MWHENSLEDFFTLNNCIRGEFTARIVDPVVTFCHNVVHFCLLLVCHKKDS